MDKNNENELIEDQIHDEINFLNELGRKAVHLNVFLIPLAYHWLKLELWFIQLVVLLVICVWLIPMEIYRLKINPNTWVNYITRSAEKEGIANYVLSAIIWLVVLIGVSFELYEMEIAELALVATVMGDSIAAIIGRGIGRKQLPLTKRKTVEGYIAGIVGTYLIGFGFLFAIGETNLFLPILPTIAWGVFDFFEDLPWYLADNIYHPLITLLLAIILRIANIL